MAGFPGGCKTVQEYGYYVHRRVTECINDHKSKEETVSYLRDQFQIESHMTNIVWENIRRSNQDFFRSYDAENNRRIREAAELSEDVPADSAMARPILSQFTNVQRNAASPSQVPQEAAHATAGNFLISVEQISSEASGPAKALQNQKQPVYPTTDFWEQLMITLGRIQSNTDQMVKLMTDGHGFRPHRSAAGSFKGKRDDQTTVRGDNEEAENLQEKERGDNDEAENLKEKEKGDNEEAENLQEKVRGDNEEAENLQEKVRGDNEEAESLQDQNLHYY